MLSGCQCSRKRLSSPPTPQVAVIHGPSSSLGQLALRKSGHLRGPDGTLSLREGEVFGAIGRRRASARRAPTVRAHGTVGAKDRMPKALFVAENTSPSFCSISNMPASVAEELLAKARRHVSSKLRVSSASSTQHTCCACCCGAVTAAEAKNSTEFFINHLLTVGAPIGTVREHRQ